MVSQGSRGRLEPQFGGQRAQGGQRIGVEDLDGHVVRARVQVGGDPPAEGRGVTAHLEAGADHVAVQVLNADPLPALRALAGQLQLTRR